MPRFAEAWDVVKIAQYSSRPESTLAVCSGRGCILGNPYQEQWWGLYKAAILETNWDKLEDRIKAAEEAIMKRASLDGEVSPDERVELEEARTALGVLKQEYRDQSTPGPVTLHSP